MSRERHPGPSVGTGLSVEDGRVRTTLSAPRPVRSLIDSVTPSCPRYGFASPGSETISRGHVVGVQVVTNVLQRKFD